MHRTVRAATETCVRSSSDTGLSKLVLGRAGESPLELIRWAYPASNRGKVKSKGRSGGSGAFRSRSWAEAALTRRERTSGLGRRLRADLRVVDRGKIKAAKCDAGRATPQRAQAD